MFNVLNNVITSAVIVVGIIYKVKLTLPTFKYRVCLLVIQFMHNSLRTASNGALHVSCRDVEIDCCFATPCWKTHTECMHCLNELRNLLSFWCHNVHIVPNGIMFASLYKTYIKITHCQAWNYMGATEAMASVAPGLGLGAPPKFLTDFN